MSKLSPNFDLSEFTFSQTAVRNGISNEPGPEVIARLVKVAHGLELVRAYLGNRPIRISSGFRSERLNQLVGGSQTSSHVAGWAVDFTVKGMTPTEVVQKIQASSLDFDQIIDEFPDSGRGWVHMSFDPRNRKQALRAVKRKGMTFYEEI